MVLYRRMFDKAAYISFLLENKLVGFFESPVKLKSGRLTSFYVNMRKASEDVCTIETLSEFLLNYVKDLVTKGDLSSLPRTFYGVPEGATKLGIITQYRYSKTSENYAPGAFTLAMGRGKRKEHGLPEDRDFLGIPKSPTVVIEDVTTTGGSLIECIKTLHSAGIEISAAIGLIDRGEKTDSGLSVKDAVSRTANLKGGAIKYFSLATSFELLPEAARILKPSIQVLEAIRKEFREFGTKEIAI